MDYKKAYLEQRVQALRMEMSLMQIRAQAIERELPEVETELKEYGNKNKTPQTK